MKFIVAVLMAMVGAAIAFSAPAAADQEAFVRTLQTRYVFLSEQQLLSEGNKICDTLRGGVSSADAAIMVRDDLGVSVAAAGNIVSAAAVDLGC